MSKEITNEDLARMIAKGFGEVDDKFKSVNKTLNEHTKQLSEIRKDLSAHDFKMTEMVHKADFFQLEERVRNIETKLKIA